MADKPSRALVLYGDGSARSVDPSNTHIHSLASVGTCGFLSLPHAPPAETEDERIVREFAHLLDASEAYTLASGLKANGSENEVSTLSERFCGDNVRTINFLIGSIMRMSQPGSEIAPRLHLSLVLSYGSVTDKDVSDFNVKKTPQEGINPAFQGLVPRQSYTMRGEKTRDNVRDYCPMLVAQWQDAVTRKDLVDTLSFEALKKLSGSLVIPADRFIHEVAFKLWKAPKYGA
ncbi:hypothetical protein HID58_039326 [Brassica napus]|uniref:Uncharacterized protein n=1 Tax=Brassica napus TaxID=3708 RepID=A0ABQ8BRW1_BRANA|nr:hypothetical protein HID58_039326 [Brassica napus]